MASKRPSRDLQAERPHRIRRPRGPLPEQSLLGPAPIHREVDERAAPRATEVVFRLAHVHARLFGARKAQRSLNRGTVLQVCREERPVVRPLCLPRSPRLPAPLLGLDVQGVVQPLLGLDVQGAARLALAVALVGQMG
ncbi:hypothetical protein TPA0910_84780 [Streptomyces hygroscopicus subsp. sporocinereus]|uniref:Uncharacterized protein n=1 Tax=Streptomyces hygroscopicus TaxID=1912 RepID=A0ABQ3UEM9_STRHY|nr:hypothetical protein TPA0910_84780 [Streptomyces hygroscopicus]